MQEELGKINLRELAEEIHPETVQNYRFLHQIPEIGL